MKFEETQTYATLASSMEDECMDGAKYKCFADMAQQEGDAGLAETLKEIATNEMAHAKVFMDFILEKEAEPAKDVDISLSYPLVGGKMPQRLQAHIESELHQGEVVYPAFARTASKEGFEDIAKAFLRVAEVEQAHHAKLKTLQQKMQNKQLYKTEQKSLWKCSNCGYSHSDVKAWEECPLCGKPQGFVVLKIEQSAY